MTEEEPLQLSSHHNAAEAANQFVYSFATSTARHAGNFDEVAVKLVQAKQRIADRYIVMWRHYWVSYSADEMLQLALSNWMPDFLYDYDRWIVAQMMKHGVAMRVFGASQIRKRGPSPLFTRLEPSDRDYFDHCKRVLWLAGQNLGIPELDLRMSIGSLS